MKNLTALLLLLVLVACPGLSALAGHQTALEAFNALMSGGETSENGQKTTETWLNEILSESGMYPGSNQTKIKEIKEEELASRLEPLSMITDKDIAAYASRHDLKVALVRNAYYKALANALDAEIKLHPATEEKYRDAQVILSLFLERNPNSQDKASMAKVREQMTSEYSGKIAEQSGLPVRFVEFLIMNENWRDDSWENDEDWRIAAGWSVSKAESFPDITIGSRDADGSTRIADMQGLLISLGYLKGKADGIFSPRTQSALLEFQLANGLKASGTYSFSDYERLISKDAVARWDYHDDFWDSDDLDSYNTPGRTDTPDKSDASDQTDTPDRTDTPDKSDASDRTDTPDKSDTPDRTDTPDDD